MLKSKNFVAPAALLALAALGGGCGDDDSDGGGTNGGADGGGTGGGTIDRMYTTIPITDDNTANKYPQPHDVYLLDAETHMPIPGFPEMYTTVDGEVTFEGLPADLQIEIWTAGSEAAMTYDSIGTSPVGAGEEFILLSGAGTADFVAMTAMFTQMQDRAAMTSAVYYTPGGPGNTRMGTVACAEVYLDDSPTSVDENTAQRYIPEVLPEVGHTATFARGAVYFGNMTKGKHVLKASLDGGNTFVGQTEFEVHAVRADARGPVKNLIYTIGIDIEEQTPADCVNVQ